MAARAGSRRAPGDGARSVMGATGKWTQPGVPHKGWVCVDIEDLGSPDHVCEMREVQDVRYVHLMTHPDYAGKLRVGCICAGHMEGDSSRARDRVTDARAVNPMLRVAAAWQRTPVEDLTLARFEQVKHWAVIALSAATALATALAAVISSLPERDSRPGKLTLVLRRLVAAHRRKVRVEFRDRIRVLHVPVDRETGLILDPDKGRS